MLKLTLFTALLFPFTLAFSTPALAEEMLVKLNFTDAEGIGEEVGIVKLEDTEYGLLITPQLKGLPQGVHGFHIHENPDCGPGVKDGKVVPGLNAGGHFDPFNTGQHEGPYGNGHLGDLPPLWVNEEGMVTIQVLAPRLKLAYLSGRSMMIHEGADNFSDEPQALGGGGARLACGIIE